MTKSPSALSTDSRLPIAASPPSLLLAFSNHSTDGLVFFRSFVLSSALSLSQPLLRIGLDPT